MCDCRTVVSVPFTVQMIQKPYVPFNPSSVVIGCYHFRVSQIKKTQPILCQIVVPSKNLEYHLLYNLHTLNKGIGFYVSVYLLNSDETDERVARNSRLRLHERLTQIAAQKIISHLFGGFTALQTNALSVKVYLLP